MKNITLSKFQKVDLKNVWVTEAGDFTPWLAKEENLAELSDALGIELELEATEKNVGPFRADILCKNLSSDSEHWVLIENQLERTDHKHLGQILTYASGLNACTIIWISSKFTEEHRNALDWLNQITNEHFSFIGIEIELWRIGNSEIAPKFNLVSRPNDWSKSVAQGASQIANEPMSETKNLQKKFWEQLNNYLIENYPNISRRNAHPQHWHTFAVGKHGFAITATVNTKEDRIGVELSVENKFAKGYFHQIKLKQNEIESQLGFSLNWQELTGKKRCRIATHKSDCDLENIDDWANQIEWMANTLKKFLDVFVPVIKKLNDQDAEILAKL